MPNETSVIAGDEPLTDTTAYLDNHTDFVQPPQKQGVPIQVLKRRGAINLYYTAVGALAAVVVFVPFISIWAIMPEQVWGGWNICIGGLIALIGAQGATQ